jgi:hypothetical protein
MSAILATSSAVLTLSKAAWSVGLSLSTLNEDADIIGSTVQDLAAEVKSLGVECDQAYTTIGEVVDKKAKSSSSTQSTDDTAWDCLAIQVDDALRMLQELEHFTKIVKGEDTRFIGQAQRLRRLAKSQEKIAHTRSRVTRHTIDLRFTLLLINM